MTVVEKAAYLKGLVEGSGVASESKEGKLWSVLCELVSDMAHEIEDLQCDSMDFADIIDEIGDELTYLEEITCDLDVPEDMFDFDEEDDEDDEVSFEEEELLDEEDEELTYDGIIYDVTCPKCGEEISFGDETLDNGSIVCPKCGEILEFDLDDMD